MRNATIMPWQNSEKPVTKNPENTGYSFTMILINNNGGVENRTS
jgi:hypothetical protein